MAWFLRRARDGQSGDIETTIGRSTTLSGDLKVDGGLRIDGRFEGTLEVGGNVIVGEHGRVVSDIDARHVTVGGAVRGNIRASGRLEILSTGQVHGDILASQVMIDEGGVLQGMSLMGEAGKPALAAPAAAAAPSSRASASRLDDDEILEAELRDADDEIVELRAQVVEREESVAPDAVAPDTDTVDTDAADTTAADTDAATPNAAEPNAAEPNAAAPNADEPSRTTRAAVDGQDGAAAPTPAHEAAAGEFVRPRSTKRVGGLSRGLDLDLAALDIEPVIPDLSGPRANGASSQAGEAKPARSRRGNPRSGSRSGKRR